MNIQMTLRTGIAALVLFLATSLHAADVVVTTQPAKPLAASFLELRIVPGDPNSSFAVKFTPEQKIAALASFKNEGPDGLAKQNAPLLWLPLRDANSNLVDCVTAQDTGGKKYLLLSSDPNQTMLAGDSGQRAWKLRKAVSQVDSRGAPVAGFEMDPAGAARMKALTGSHIGCPLAIIVNNQVYAAPRIMSVIAGAGQITGHFTAAEVTNLVNTLNTGILLNEAAKNNVAPSSLSPSFNAPASSGTSTSAPASAPAITPQARAILDALEKSGEKYTTTLADVVFTVEDRAVGDAEERSGAVIYAKASADAPARFRISFATLKQGELEAIQKPSFKPLNIKVDYAFDGMWLTKADHKLKQLDRYQVAAKGEKVEPLRIGKGPFPLPFGQKADDVLKYFAVTTRPVTDKDVPNADYLKLVTLPEHQKDINFSALEMWVDRATGLPVKAVSQERKKGELVKVSTAEFKNVQTNKPVEDKVFEIPREIGWQVNVRPLDGK